MWQLNAVRTLEYAEGKGAPVGCQSGPSLCRKLQALRYPTQTRPCGSVQAMVDHAVRLASGKPAPEKVETKPEGGWLGKLTGFLRQT